MLVNNISNISQNNIYNHQNYSINKNINVTFGDALNSCSQRYMPWFSCELERLKAPIIFNKIGIFNKLNPAEKEQCYKDIISSIDDCGGFFTTLFGYKPACTIYDANSSPEFLNKIIYKTPTTIVHAGRTINPEFFNSYVINRDMVYEIIDEDKQLFTSRLNLNQFTPTKDVYSALISCLSNNSNSIKDLEGIILGFPKYNSIIFQLEHISKAMPYRADKNLHRTKLADALYAWDSPYRKLPTEEFNEIAKQVRMAEIKKTPKNPYFQYVKFVDESETEECLFQTSRNFNGEFSADNLISLH